MVAMTRQTGCRLLAYPINLPSMADQPKPRRRQIDLLTCMTLDFEVHTFECRPPCARAPEKLRFEKICWQLARQISTSESA